MTTPPARALDLERNPFDSVTPRPLDAPARRRRRRRRERCVDLEHYENAPPCDGVKALIIVARDAIPPGRWPRSRAAGAPQTKLVRVGRRGRRQDSADRRVEPRRASSSGSLALPAADVPAEQAAAAAARAATPPRRPRRRCAVVGGATAVPADIASKIQKISANEFNIDRSVVDKILENQAELMRSARIVPEQENGKVVGIRLFGIRPDTLLGTLGMENGDRLQTINGFDMASPEKALEAYARLRTADQLTVQVNRRGANQNIDFNIK